MVGIVALHLIVTEDKVLEGVDIANLFEFIAVGFDKMDNKGFDVLALDEFEKLEAGGVEKVVAGHGFVDDMENWREDLGFNHLGAVKFVL